MSKVDLNDNKRAIYNSFYQISKITVHKIQTAIMGSISKITLGVDQIPNLILKLLIEITSPILIPIF